MMLHRNISYVSDQYIHNILFLCHLLSSFLLNRLHKCVQMHLYIMFKYFSLLKYFTYTFSNPPGVLSPSDLLAVSLNDGVASYYSQRQLVLGKKQHVGKCKCFCAKLNTTRSLYVNVVDFSQYLDLLHQPVLLFVVCLRELVDLDFVFLDFSHDLAKKTEALLATPGTAANRK